MWPAVGEEDGDPDTAFRRKLEGVGKQVLEDLLNALRIRIDGLAERLIEIDVKCELPPLGFVTERPRDRLEKTVE